MITRWLVIILLVVALMPLAGVSAQTVDENAVFCGDLAEADCQLLKDNYTTMDAVSAFSFDLSMSLDVAESMGGGAGETSLVLDAQGSMSLDPAAMTAIKDASDQVEGMGEQILTEELATLLDAFVAGLTGRITLDLSAGSAEEVTELSLHVLMKEGVFALNAQALEALSGEPVQGMDWLGLDAEGVFSLLMDDPSLSGSLNSLVSPPADGADKSEIRAAANNVTRLADSEINGVAVAVFESSPDLEILTDLLLDMAGPADSMDDADVEALMSAMTLIMRQHIGLSDFYSYSTELYVTVESHEVSSSANLFDMAVVINMSDFNEPVAVEIPDDAMILPISMLLQMGS